ncbi:MAG: hemerythrin domain-containing protein [Rhodospirillales bacterium]
MTDTHEIGEMLHDEHLHTLAFANALETRIFEGRGRPLDPANAADAAFIDTLLAVIDEDIEGHFRFEEEVLFPKVNDAGLNDVTAMLADEHQLIRTMADDLRSLAIAARAGERDPAQWTQFRDVAMDFIHATMFHIQKEEMGIIRSLSVTLGAETGRSMAADYATRKGSPPAGP